MYFLFRVLAPVLACTLCSTPSVGVYAHAANAAAADPAQTPAAPTLKVDTKLVVVPVVVRDRKGQLVKTLRKEDFTLAENNKPQTIKYFDRDSEAPLTIGLLVDVSGSMRNELDEERTASSAFLDTLLRPNRDKAFIVQFARQADLLADVTSSLPKLEAGLKHLDPDASRPQFGGGSSQDPNDTGSASSDPQSSGSSGGRHGGRGGYGGGGTVLYDAIFLSADEVLHKEANRKALILLTDGDDRGSKESITSAIEAAQRANATVYAVYYKGEQGGGGGGFPGGRHGGGFPGGGGGWPGGGGGGWPGGSGRSGGQGRGGEERHDGKKILERICGETGGRVFEVSRKQPIEDIYKQISEELRSEYLLGFAPTDASEGYHRIDVDVPSDKKDILQARDGYYIGGSQ